MTTTLIREELGPAMGTSIVALALTCTALAHFFWLTADRTDFLARYNEGLAWRTAAPLYQSNPTMNTHPPSVTQWVFAPMSRVPYEVAQWVCVVINLIGVLASLRLITVALGLCVVQAIWVAALLFLTQGMFQHWAAGQFIGILMYPLTRAWLACREGRDWAAGAWLAPAIAIKPPLALLALLLPWRIIVSAAALSGGISLLGVVTTGIGPWRQWWEAGARVDWLTTPFNASVWGVAARIQVGEGAVTLAQLETYLTISVLLFAGVLAWLTVRQVDRNRRFLCAGLWSVLLSPLGWVYYLPLLTGPIIALWNNSRGGWLSYAVMVLPIGMDQGLGVLGGSIFFISTLGAWINLRPRAPRATISTRTG